MKNQSLKFLSVIALLIIFSSCKKDTSWNSKWVVPLVNDTLDISKFVNDSTLDGSGTNYVMDLTRTLYELNLEDLVAIPDTSIDRTTALNSTGFNVAPGFTFYNSVEEHELLLGDVELKKISLSEGKLSFKLENPIETGVYITFELPGVSQYSIPFSQTYFIGAGTLQNPSSINETIDLSGYDLDLQGEFGNSFNILQSRVKIKSDPNGVPVTVNNQDSFRIVANFSDIHINYARGYFGQQSVIDTTSFENTVLNNVLSGAIDLQNTSVKLMIENGIKIDGIGNIHFIQNTNKQGNTVALTGGNHSGSFNINQPMGSYNSLQPSIRELLYNSGNSNIESFIENLGIHNEVAYEIQVNPWGNTSGGWNEVYPQSKLKLAIEAQMPLDLQLDNLKICDTFDLVVNQNHDATHVDNGKIVLELDNAFPFSGDLSLYFLDENFQILDSVSADNSIQSSLFGIANSYGLLHQESLVEIPVSSEIVDQLNKTKSIMLIATFNTPSTSGGNQVVSIPVGAYLKVRAKANFQLNIRL